MLYFPDTTYKTQLIKDGFYDAKSFDEIRESAFREFGVPASFLTSEADSVTDMHQLSEDALNVYYLDDFTGP